MKTKRIIPCLSYKDPKNAIKWLKEAFGFEEHQIFEENGTIVHAELKMGNAMIMVSPQEGDGSYKKLITHPSETNGTNTQSPYIVLDQVKKHYENAKNYGAKIALEFAQPAYGGESYSCFDLEGHLWNFGSYDPYAALQNSAEKEVEKTEKEWNLSIKNNNVEEMDKFMRDDWSIVGTQGITFKMDFLNAVKSGDLVHTKMDFETKMIKTDGNTATITQLGTSAGIYKGEPFSFYEWSTSVLIKENAQWKAILTTLTPA